MQDSMIRTQLKRLHRFRLYRGLLVLVLLGILISPAKAAGETLGIKDARGNFVPKVTVTVAGKEVVIQKTNPQDSFTSIALALNQKYHKLIQNLKFLEIQWVDANNTPGKPLPFAGPRFNPSTIVFQDSMTKSVSLKLLDKTKLNLFAGKNVADLFTISIGGQQLISADEVGEKERTVQLGTGRDVSINVDKTTIVFDQTNLKMGEWLSVDNRSGNDQILGVEVPEKGLLFDQIVRKPEQTKVPRENWDRFTVASDSGIQILLIPEPEPGPLSQLNGKEIIIKVFQGNKIRETRKIPIKISSDLRGSGKSSGETGESLQREESGQSARREVAPPRGAAEPVEASAPPARRESASTGESAQTSRRGGALWLWILQIFNLILLAGLAVYAIFFMLPKLQVLEDRLAKNEMFIHGVREAIREELDQIKAEILRQCQKDPSEE